MLKVKSGVSAANAMHLSQVEEQLLIVMNTSMEYTVVNTCIHSNEYLSNINSAARTRATNHLLTPPFCLFYPGGGGGGAIQLHRVNKQIMNVLLGNVP